MRIFLLVFSSTFLCGRLLCDVPGIPVPEAEIYPSLRMECLGRELTGIISDNLTDMLWNPARLPEKNGIAGEFPNRLVCVIPGPLGLRLGVCGKIKTCGNESFRERTSSVYDDEYYSLDKEEWQQEQWRGALLISKKLSDKTTFGIKYKYDNSPYSMKDISVRNSLDSTSNHYDYYRDIDIREHNYEYKNSTLAHSITLGWFRNLGKSSSIELISDFQLNDESTNLYSEQEDFDSTVRISQYSPTSGHVSMSARTNNSFTKEEAIVSPFSIGVGGKYSNKLSDMLTFHIAGMTYAGKGKAKSSALDSSFYFYRYDRYDYDGSDTTNYSSDTTISSDFSHDSLEGEATVVTGFLKAGGEINVTSDLVAGFGVCVSYEYLNLPMQGTLCGEELEESYSSKTIYIKVPFGMEYTIGKGLSFRLGLLATETYSSSILEEKGQKTETSSLCGPSFTKTAGFGWKLFKNLNIDVAATPLMNVYSWRIQVSYVL
ncbi:hypothetical protein KAW50_00730 [candidate division WOR-3 bacterium]|nr:hypothetical protein [candidate division WOR-3 bacterium]